MSFSLTSTNITLSGSVLSADCGDDNGNFHASSIDLNNVLGNVNGNFSPGSSGWFNTATNVRLVGQSLTAILFNANDQGVSGQINLDE
jgi:hypothetical protein